MRGERERITVHIKYRDVEQTFEGEVEQVWVGVNRFFAQLVPGFEAVQKAVITVSLSSLIDDCKNVVAVAPEGPCVLVPAKKLTDGETLVLNLLAAYIGHKLGVLSKESLSKEELRVKLGKSAKITSTRLGELCREGLAAKTEDGEYRITTFGIRRVQDEVLPRIRARLRASG